MGNEIKKEDLLDVISKCKIYVSVYWKLVGYEI